MAGQVRTPKQAMGSKRRQASETTGTCQRLASGAGGSKPAREISCLSCQRFASGSGRNRATVRKQVVSVFKEPRACPAGITRKDGRRTFQVT